ncbi:MAG: amidohydrolase [Actinobacteria bacterium]|nr:amidohydrolase [Actinomycetota bacterium]MBU1944906.1 amidohydrolase [Actinomycetota bacterium]MBU2688110.1 amidohydrolase [Actinomycetota bacterium]
MGFFDWLASGPEIQRTGTNPADTVLVNGRVLTCETDGGRASSFAVKDGRFVYVGDDAGIADFVGPDTEIIDARDRIVTPGFIDSHNHVLWVGSLEPLLSRALYECKSFEEYEKAVLEHSGDNPDLPFVYLMGWNHDHVPGGVCRKETLDEVVADRPLVLWSECAHAGWVNTPMVKLMQERNPEAFEQLLPVRDDSGEPTGEFLTFWFFEPLNFFTLEEFGEDLRERMLQGMANALDAALAVGVTGHDDVMVHKSFIPMILEFRERGGFERARVRGTFYINHHMAGDLDELRAFLTGWKELAAKESDEHIVLGKSVKMGTDGVSTNHTAYLLEPYADRPDYRGEPSWKVEDYNAVVELAHELGLQVATHACGDAAIRDAINGYERVAPDGGKLPLPYRVDHCVMPTAEDQERMARLGISAAMQPAHFWYGEAGPRALGPERMQRVFPHRSMAERGVRISFGSDWCAGPINPMYGLFLAATRLNYRGKVEWGLEEKISLETGIRHWTADSAADVLREEELGTIEVGKLADFVVFNTDPLKLDTWWFMLTHKLDLGGMDDFVDMTYVGGKRVYEKQPR